MKIFNKKAPVIAVCAVAVFSLCNPVFATEEKKGTGKVAAYELGGDFYYEIGGSGKIKKRKNRQVPVGGGIQWDNNLMCGDFDMSLSVTNILNGVTGEIEKLADDMLASVTGVISSWPMMEIARSDPQLYEFMQQGKLEASEMFGASVASCEEMTDKMISGDKDAVSGWVEVSGHEDWMDSSQEAESTDVVQLEEDIDKDKGENGVKWVGGDKKGGKEQEPIKVEKDAIIAGYNQLANRSATSTSSLDHNDDNPWYAEFWSTPEKAEKWITSIIGTTELKTCKECDRLKTTPGKGVYGKLEEEQAKIEELIVELLDSPNSNYDVAMLDSISAPGFRVNQAVMDALKEESAYQDRLVESLSEEVATVRIIEMLIAGRRLLLSGKREAYIARNKEAVGILDDRVAEITGEMQLLKLDSELRNTAKQSVAVTLIKRKNIRDNVGNNEVDENFDNAIRSITGRKR